jgi:Flp pilus assembly protein TadD
MPGSGHPPRCLSAHMHPRILDALRRGANAEALSLARLAVAETPQDAQAQSLLAHAARANGDTATALSAISRAVLLAPDDASLHFQRAGFLLGEHKFNEAQAALSRSIDLDPNQFDAYIAQAQIAVGRGDYDEAERLQRMAALIQPEHPWVKAVAGIVASFRGDGTRAQMLLTQASTQAPNDPQVLYALGFAHMKQGQLGFAEQTFRRVIELAPNMSGLRGLLADLLLQQQRPAEAREVLQPLLDDPETATPALKRMTAELEWMLGRHDASIALLREAFRADPRDPRTAAALAKIWRFTGAMDEARSALDTALAEVPTLVHLWQLRMAFEPEAGEGARTVVDRWLAAMPDHTDALDAQMHLLEATGRRDESEAVARRIVELEPGRTSAELRVLQALLRDDPDAGVRHVQSLITRAHDENAKRALLPWLGYAQDRAGRRNEAAMTWNAFNQADAPSRWPLISGTGAHAPWPEAATISPGRPPVAYLYGVPGSGVEHVATVIAHAGYPLRADRLGPRPPQDPLQNPDAIKALADGALTPSDLLQQWQAALPARGVHDGIVIDWLPFWDNALLKMTRPLQPEAIVLFAIRDPRDMLLEWIAFGSRLPYGVASVNVAAAWMAEQLKQMIELDRDKLQLSRLIRTDHIHADPEAFAADVGAGLALEEIRVPPPQAFGPERFAYGHWHEYAKPLGDAFAHLSEVAQQLGYPAE